MAQLQLVSVWLMAPMLLVANVQASSIQGPVRGRVELADRAVLDDVVVRLRCSGSFIHGGHQTDHELRVIKSREPYLFLWAWRGISPIGCSIDVLHPLYRQAHLALTDAFWQEPEPIRLEPWAHLLEDPADDLSTADLYRHLFYLRHYYLDALGDGASRAARYVPRLHSIFARGLRELPPMSKERFGSPESALENLRAIEKLVRYERPPVQQALFTAAAAGNTAGVVNAIARRAEPDAWDHDGRAALHLAAEAGHTETLIALLDAGAHADHRAEGLGRTPVLLAMQHHHTETVLALIERGADVTLAALGVTPLGAGCRQGMRPEILQALLEAGAIQRAREPRHRSYPLRAASRNGRTWIVKALLQEGVPIDAGLPNWTALMAASKAAKLETAHFLIDAGADVNARTIDGRTALSLARMGRRKDIIELLLRSGARESVTKAKERGRSPRQQVDVEPDVGSRTDPDEN